MIYVLKNRNFIILDEQLTSCNRVPKYSNYGKYLIIITTKDSSKNEFYDINEILRQF